MCGVIGVFSGLSGSCAALEASCALSFLQHRGQDAAGIAGFTQGQMKMHCSQGLVREIFNDTSLSYLAGSTMSIGHVRYPTTILRAQEDTQPFYVNYPYGIVMAHNGNLVNIDELEDLVRQNKRHLNTHSDSELLLNLFACEIASDRRKMSVQLVVEALERLHRKLRGSYAVVAMIPNFGLVAFRDPHGLRPLVHGVKEVAGISQHMIASESAALVAMGYDVVDDVRPGECLVITMDGKIHRHFFSPKHVQAVCVFEHVYFARPDSVIDGVSVYKSRLRMGENLAAKIQAQWSDHVIDSVIPVPETSRAAAISVAQCLNVPFREGFVKNHYVGRTFIASQNKARHSMVRRKLNVLPLEFKGKNVLIIDDSIVRGNTSREIVRMAYEAGAKKVYLASASPPVRHPNIYGIDITTHQELIAHQRTVEQIADILGVDGLIYQSIEALVDAVQAPGRPTQCFDLSCFNGKYVTGDESQYIRRIYESRASRHGDQESQNTWLF